MIGALTHYEPFVPEFDVAGSTFSPMKPPPNQSLQLTTGRHEKQKDEIRK
jgi:hypothetical protein